MKKVLYFSLVLCLAVSLGFASDFKNLGKTDFSAVGTPNTTFLANEYAYDDGGTEDALGLTAGGQIMWIQWFDVLPGKDTITEITTAWGSAGGSVMPDGTPGFVYLYSDPNGDGDPSDCVLLASAATTVQGGGTDAFTVVDIPDTVVSGRIFIGASCDQNAGTYMAPMDQSNTPTGGQAWVVGDTTFNLDATDLTNNDVPPTQLQPIGFDSYLLSRAPYDYVSQPLEVDKTAIDGNFGMELTFDLAAGAVHANKDFLILGTASGTVPGIDLPNGGNLPINWDAKTEQFLDLTLSGNPGFPLYGTLDGNGDATVNLTVNRKIYADYDLHFAYTVDTLDWASNAVNVVVTGAPVPGPEYAYDDGTTENALGLTAGGQICWLQWFDAVVGNDTLTEVHTAWGSVGGSVMPDGTPGFVYVWDDPTNDGDPSDAVLLASVATTVTGGGTDAFTVVDIPDTFVSGKFFIGASCDQNAGTYMSPMDTSSIPTGGQAWIVGDTTFNFDATNLLNNDVTPLAVNSIGFDSYFLTRAPYL